MERRKWKYSSLHVYSCHRSKQGLIQCRALSQYIVFASPYVGESPPTAVKSSLQWANRNQPMLRVDSSCLLSAFRNRNCWMICFLRPAQSDHHPYANSEWPCTFITRNLPRQIHRGNVHFPDLHLHTLLHQPSPYIFCSLVHLELSKKFNHLCWNFPCFISDQMWVWVFLKSQRKIPLAACELKWSAKTKKHFPHLRGLLATSH